MSRFANPARTERFIFPDGCKCTGTPHEQDWMALRTELGAEDIAKLEAWSVLGAVGGVLALSLLIREWNLLDDDGNEVPPSEENIKLLWSDLIGDELNDWIDKHVRKTSLPNGSGGRSASGSSATASRTRGKRRSSTTSS